MKKSYLRAFVILLAAGALLLAFSLLAPFVSLAKIENAESMGIIGGAGVYTYSFIFWRQFLGFGAVFAFLGGAMVLSSAFALIFHKLVSKTCGLITSLHALALSVFGSTMLIFLFRIALMLEVEDVARYPYALPAFMVCAVLCIILFIGLLISYFIQWYKRASFRGLFLEMMLAIIYLPASFLFSFWSINLLQEIFSYII